MGPRAEGSLRGAVTFAVSTLSVVAVGTLHQLLKLIVRERCHLGSAYVRMILGLTWLAFAVGSSVVFEQQFLPRRQCDGLKRLIQSKLYS